MKSKFEQWFQQQPFYLNMRFIYGDQLFTSENDVYRVLAVQIAWATWQEQQKRIDSIKTKSIEQALKLSSMSERNNKQAEIIKEQRKLIDELQLKVSEDSRILHNIINIERNKCDGLQARIDEAIKHFNNVRNLGKDHSVYRALKALKGSEPKVQEPQACDHIMTEKTQFGDLQRSFECIFCDHKTTEAWVTKHE
ncbi:hypothetical protein [Acinetobacter brisouii]|uniref:hypothetical protein n=1 Tax=Acinetobacter brisouii TaxID=396323 RepID=UPI00125059B5|nr:hypothetical protein [Acinetobacter brisouii]